MKKRFRAFLLLTLLVVLMLTSCLSKKDISDKYYFQSLAEENSIVVTVDTRDFKRLGVDLKQENELSALLNRISRFSIAFDLPKEFGDDELITNENLINYNFRGAIEGSIPSFITNTILLKSNEWEKRVYANNIRSYRNETLELEVYAPKKNLLLFANDNYLEHYFKSYKNRQILIDVKQATSMANSLFGFYIASPQAMLDIGLKIPKSALLQSNSIMLYVNETDERKMVLGGSIVMKSERLTSSLSILLKSSYIADKRRQKESFGDLTNLFIVNKETLLIEGLALNEDQVTLLMQLFGQLLSPLGVS
jgi:hypothetical protein